MASDPPDPGAFFRDMMAQWGKTAGGAANGDRPKPEDFVRLLFGATGATGGAQAAFKEMTERALAAASVPTRSEIDELSARIGRIEAALFRIEARLGEMGTGSNAEG